MEIVKLAAIMAILVIELTALYMQVDGFVLASALTIIGGIAGFEIGAKREHARMESQPAMDETKAT